MKIERLVSVSVKNDKNIQLLKMITTNFVYFQNMINSIINFFFNKQESVAIKHESSQIQELRLITDKCKKVLMDEQWIYINELLRITDIKGKHLRLLNDIFTSHSFSSIGMVVISNRTIKSKRLLIDAMYNHCVKPVPNDYALNSLILYDAIPQCEKDAMIFMLCLNGNIDVNRFIVSLFIERIKINYCPLL